MATELTIKGASFGMDSKGAEKYIEDIKATVLKKASKKLEDNVKKFNNEIEGYWHGEAKDRFQKRIEADAKDLAKKLEDLEKVLEVSFQTAQKNLETYDDKFSINAGIKM